MPRNDNDMEFPDMRSINPGDMLNSLFEMLGFENHQAEESIRTFFTAWSEENYDKAYGQLASNSPLREGLSRKAWVERRRAWVNQAQAQNMIFDVAMAPDDEDDDEETEITATTSDESENPQPHIIEVKTALSIAKPDEDDEDDDDEDDDEEDLGPKEVEVFWTLEITGDDKGEKLPEIPTATLILKDAGDHWFWSSFTVVQEEEKWLIQDVQDKGAEALNLSADEIKELQEELIERIGELAEEVEELGSDDLDDDDFESEDDEDGEDDEDEDEEEFGDLEFAELAGRVQETMWLTLRTLSYGDILFSKLPGDHEVYENVYSQASQFKQFDRAAAYAQIQAERVPEQRADTLRDYAVAITNLSDLLASDEELEEEERQDIIDQYAPLAEKALTVSIAIDDAPHAHILFANILIRQNTRLEEATAHLEQLKNRDLDTMDRTYIAIGEANIARLKNEPENALARYQEAAALSPDIPHIWFNIGHFQRELGDFTAAQENLGRSIDEDPQEVEAYTELAAIYTQMNALPEAQELLEDGLELNPDSVDLLAALSLVHTSKGDLKAAEEFLDEAEEIDGGHYLVEQARQQFDAAKIRQRQQKGKPQSKNKPSQQQNNKKKK